MRMEWGDPIELPEHTDTGAVEAGYVSVTYLSRIADDPSDDLVEVSAALDGLVPSPRR